MFENTDKNNDIFSGEGLLDLGSDDSLLGNEIGFDPFAGSGEGIPLEQSEGSDASPKVEGEKDQTKENGNEEEKKDGQQEKTGDTQASAKTGTEPEAVDDPFAAAIAKAEEKQASDAKAGLIDKLPVFSYANAEEDIVDPSITFDKLRNDKAEDFPELDDGTSVSWKMEYGKITKTIPTPKKTTIAELKSQIETSMEFLDSLKKVKGEVKCKVIPSVAAKKKGYSKGMCSSVQEAVDKGMVIAFVPSCDGSVYEVRPNKVGTFIAKADGVTILPRVRAGFIPALPRIPFEVLNEIIAFFRKKANAKCPLEAVAEIYWSYVDSKYYAYVPNQTVSSTGVDFTLPELDGEKYQRVLEIHSHNRMDAYFSHTDDLDERATGIYAVVGKLDNFFPEIKTRISVGGKFVEISPSEVFELPDTDYPYVWDEAIKAASEKGANNEAR